jgi:hypothetical protein
MNLLSLVLIFSVIIIDQSILMEYMNNCDMNKWIIDNNKVCTCIKF